MALGCLWWHAWFPVDGVVAAAIGVASVALGDIGLHFVWQAWAFTLRGRRGTYGTGLPLVNQSTWTDAHTLKNDRFFSSFQLHAVTPVEQNFSP